MEIIHNDRKVEEEVEETEIRDTNHNSFLIIWNFKIVKTAVVLYMLHILNDHL